MKEAVGVLLEGTPNDVDITKLREAMKELPSVTDVHDLHVWSLTSGVNAMSAHVVVAAETNTQNGMLTRLNELITLKFKIAHTTLQLELHAYQEKEAHL